MRRSTPSMIAVMKKSPSPPPEPEPLCPVPPARRSHLVRKRLYLNQRHACGAGSRVRPPDRCLHGDLAAEAWYAKIHMSLLADWSAVTHDFGLVHAPTDLVARHYVGWQRRLHPSITCREFSSFAVGLAALPPLSVEKRRLELRPESLPPPVMGRRDEGRRLPRTRRLHLATTYLFWSRRRKTPLPWEIACRFPRVTQRCSHNPPGD